MSNDNVNMGWWAKQSKELQLKILVTAGIFGILAIGGAIAGGVIGALLSNRKVITVTVTTFAGNGSNGFSDGDLSSAMFSGPIDLCADLFGNLYVADSQNARIRKVSRDGLVTTLAGSTQGYSNGPGNTAQFYAPMGITIDANGTLYVADAAGFTIRTINSTSGYVSLLAGSNLVPGGTNGPASSATFNSPRGIITGKSGAVYVSELSGHKIRKIFNGNVCRYFLLEYHGCRHSDSPLSGGAPHRTLPWQAKCDA